MPVLATVNGNVSFTVPKQNDPSALARIAFPALKQIDGTFAYSGIPDIESIDLPELVTCGAVNLGNPGTSKLLTSVSMPETGGVQRRITLPQPLGITTRRAAFAQTCGQPDRVLLQQRRKFRCSQAGDGGRRPRPGAFGQPVPGRTRRLQGTGFCRRYFPHRLQQGNIRIGFEVAAGAEKLQDVEFIRLCYTEKYRRYRNRDRGVESRTGDLSGFDDQREQRFQRRDPTESRDQLESRQSV